MDAPLRSARTRDRVTRRVQRTVRHHDGRVVTLPGTVRAAATFSTPPHRTSTPAAWRPADAGDGQVVGGVALAEQVAPVERHEHHPRRHPGSRRAGSATVPRRLDSCTARRRRSPAGRRRAGAISTNGPGSRRTSLSPLPVRVSVCQWAYSRPVVSTNGNSWSVSSRGRGAARAGTRARPSGVGNTLVEVAPLGAGVVRRRARPLQRRSVAAGSAVMPAMSHGRPRGQPDELVPHLAPPS